MANENLAKDLSDFLSTKNYEVRYTDERGKDSSPEEAKVFAFDWIVPSSGKNYGTAVVVLGDENDLQLFFGDNLGKSIDNAQDKEQWFEFMKQLKDFSTRHNIGTFTPLDINQLKHTMQGMAAIKEGLFEGYYGNKHTSYVGEATEARLVIRHNRMIGENDKRYRYVESLFIETRDGERFKLPFTKLAGGRAMLEHVRQGGNPYDIRGQHIKAVVQEMNVLARFNRASQHKIFEGQTAQLVEHARNYYAQLKENLTHWSTARGYCDYFESWSPADISEQTHIVEDIKQLFVEQTIDARIEAAVPILARLQQGNAMKEVTVFENWINRLAEGTWALPDTPEANNKLKELMSQELIVGPDATNATEQLYDVIGDDQLFDILGDLARRDPRANIWDDTDVQQRLSELGIQTPQSSEAEPADVSQDTAPTEPLPEGLADEIMGTLRARGMNARLAGTPDQEKQRTRDMIAQRDQSRSQSLAQMDISQLENQLRTLQQRYQQLGGSGWQYADREQNLTDQEREARSLEPEIRRLQDLISQVKKAQESGSVKESNMPGVMQIGLGSSAPTTPGQYAKQQVNTAAGKSSSSAGSDFAASVNEMGGDTPIEKMSPDELAEYIGADNNWVRLNMDVAQDIAREVAQKLAGDQLSHEMEATMTPGEKAAMKIAVPAFKRPNNPVTLKDIEKARERTHSSPEGLHALQARLGMKEAAELRRMVELARVPVKESVLTDSTGHTFNHIINRFKREVADFKQGAELDYDLYDALHDYYFDDMPYGVKKARDGDPRTWVSNRFSKELGLGESNSGMIMPEADPMDTFEMGVMGPAMGAGFAEGATCNMTAEGEYCPEHGLTECGTYEAVQDPINANSAITGSFYESELDRIKKLALAK